MQTTSLRMWPTFVVVVLGALLVATYWCWELVFIVKDLNTACILNHTTKYPITGLGHDVILGQEFYPKNLTSLCDVKNLTAIVIVNSAVGSLERRRVLRKSLADACAVFNCKVVFLVAATLDADVMERVRKEVTLHRDVIMVPKVDAYKAINNKLVAMLKWLKKYCTGAKYVVFMNEDTFVNFDLFYDELETHGGEECNCIVGDAHSRSKVFRDADDSRWSMTKEEYSCDIYPVYCTGPAYAFPNAVTSLLLFGAYDAHHVWPDDVWLTGLVRQHVGVRIFQRRHNIWMRQKTKYDRHFGARQYQRYLFVHNVTSEQQSDAYYYMLNGHSVMRLTIAAVCIMMWMTLFLMCIVMLVLLKVTATEEGALSPIHLVSNSLHHVVHVCKMVLILVRRRFTSIHAYVPL